MIRSARVFLVLLVLFGAAGAYANDYEVWTTYYSCAFTAVGGSLLECDNGYWSWQQQSGMYKSVERYSCYGGAAGPIDWYQWNGSSWVLLPDQPEEDC